MAGMSKYGFYIKLKNNFYSISLNKLINIDKENLSAILKNKIENIHIESN